MPPRAPPWAPLVFSCIFIWLVFFTPDNPTHFTKFSWVISQRFEKHRASLSALNNSTWGDFAPPQNSSDHAADAASFLNLTGFRETDGFAWDDLSWFRRRCEEWSQRVNPALGAGEDPLQAGGQAVWQNATGVVKGDWVRKVGSSVRWPESYNVTNIDPDHSWLSLDFPWSRNITGSEGKMVLDMVDTGRNIQEKEHSDQSFFVGSGGRVRSAKASVEIEDINGSGMTWEMRMHGVRWPRTGTIMLTTTSPKFDGIFGLPHLATGPGLFRSSQTLLNETVTELLKRESSSFFVDMTPPWSSEVINPAQEAVNPTPHCEFVLYAQVHPTTQDQLGLQGVGGLKNTDMLNIINGIEHELRVPNGAPIPNVPELQMSAILWSPDCSFFLETKGPPDFLGTEGQHLVGNKIEVIYGQIRFWVLAFAGVFMAQVFLLKYQMRESSTPSTLWRISYNSISFMTILDGMTFAAAAMWVLDAGITFLESLALLFAALQSMSIGALFMSEIYKVQRPEERRRQGPTPGREPPASTSSRETPQNTADSSAPRTPAGTEAGSTTATPAPGNTPVQRDEPPIIIPSDQDMDAEINDTPDVRPNATPAPETRGMVVGRFFLLSTALLFGLFVSTSWSSQFRALFTNALALLYLSFWIPQIHRNIVRNCRRALTWRFMLGQSALRLAPLAYFWLKEDNFLLAEPDRQAFLVFCAWIWVQLWVLAFQDVLGPRFGIPAGWAPEAWDYHPVLREDNLEDGSFPVGLLSSLEPVQTDEPPAGAVSSASASQPAGDTSAAAAAAAAPHPPPPPSAKDKSPDDVPSTPGLRGTRKATTECAICFDSLEVPVVKAGESDASVVSGVAGALTRRNYMVTPCRHIFHSPCLESWLRYRLKCPICRDDLPPL